MKPADLGVLVPAVMVLSCLGLGLYLLMSSPVAGGALLLLAALNVAALLKGVRSRAQARRAEQPKSR